MKTWTYITPDFEQCKKIVLMGRCAGLSIAWMRSVLKWQWFYELKYLPNEN